MREIGYALTMAPVQPSDLDPSSIPPAYTPRGYMPSHFFINDQILLTMGHHDQAMVSTLISMEDALGRHQMCLPPNGVR